MKDCKNCGWDEHDTLVPSSAKTDIERLIAEANLARMRGDLNGAIDLCTEALDIEPHNADVHSLLGDIYKTMDNQTEAARWYQMALDINPNSKSDQAKLQEALAAASKKKRANSNSPTNNWLQPVDKLDRAIRYFVLFCAAAVMVLLIIGLTTWLINSRKENKAPTESPTPKTESVENVQSKTVSAPPVESPIIGEPEGGTLIRPLAEQTLLSKLATNPTIQQEKLVIEDVKIDPRTDGIEITMRFSDKPTALTHIVIRKAAAVAATAAYGASDDAKMVTVRTLVSMPGEYASGEPKLAHICDIPRDIVSVNISGADDAVLSRIFVKEWWNSEIGL
mgnify:CR=1 FL=1